MPRPSSLLRYYRFALVLTTLIASIAFWLAGWDALVPWMPLAVLELLSGALGLVRATTSIVRLLHANRQAVAS